MNAVHERRRTMFMERKTQCHRGDELPKPLYNKPSAIPAKTPAALFAEPDTLLLKVLEELSYEKGNTLSSAQRNEVSPSAQVSKTQRKEQNVAPEALCSPLESLPPLRGTALPASLSMK